MELFEEEELSLGDLKEEHSTELFDQNIDNVADLLRDNELEDFEFSFVGDTKRGRVHIELKGKELWPLRVINNKGQWEMDEFPAE